MSNIIKITPYPFDASHYVGVDDKVGGSFAKTPDGEYVVLLRVKSKSELIYCLEQTLHYIEEKCNWFIEDKNE